MNAATESACTIPATLTLDAFFIRWDVMEVNCPDPSATALHEALRPLLDGSVGVRGADDGDTCLSAAYYWPK
jgi:hypothetical protein